MQKDYEEVSISVLGLDCYECSKIIRKALSKVDGVSFVGVNYMMDKVTVKFDPKKVTKKDIEKTIEELGYHLAYKSYESKREKLRRRILNV
ncbi:MAG: heavy metal-associated domain-containing protein [Nitrososphaeria archaeon]